MKRKLIDAGYKLTAPRLAVLDALSSAGHLISARGLHKKIQEVDLASVYRALNLFEELHLVDIEVIEKEKFYCLADIPHHHIICERCGHAEKVECNHSFGRLKNFINVYHRLTLTGICNKCAK